MGEGVSKLIKNTIDRFSLDLRGLNVFTEAGTNSYMLTPLIASMAGANKVYAVIKDSRFGKKEQIRANLKKFAMDNVHIIEHRHEHISECDIITNLGFVRPIDRKFIDSIRKGAVISLMWETWEFRDCDLDLAYAWKKKIPVLGTNESEFDFFKYIGPLCAKKLSEHITLDGSFLVIGNKDDRFSIEIAKELSNYGRVYAISDSDQISRHAEVIGNNAASADLNIAGLKAVIVSTYPDSKCVLDGSSNLPKNVLCMQFKGNIDRESLQNKIIPEVEPAQGCMAYTVAEVSDTGTVELNTAGLKVGEIMAKNMRILDWKSAIKKSLEHGLCQDFSPKQKQRYGYGNN